MTTKCTSQLGNISKEKSKVICFFFFLAKQVSVLVGRYKVRPADVQIRISVWDPLRHVSARSSPAWCNTEQTSLEKPRRLPALKSSCFPLPACSPPQSSSTSGSNDVRGENWTSSLDRLPPAWGPSPGTAEPGRTDEGSPVALTLPRSTPATRSPEPHSTRGP